MKKIFAINTLNTTYAIGVDDYNLVRHIYWGKKLDSRDLEILDVWNPHRDYTDLENAQQEYTVFGGKMYRNCAFKCKYFDGCRDSVFCYESDTESENELIITLVDKVYDVRIELHYIHYDDSDIITRFARIINSSLDDLTINKMMSCEICLPSEQPYFINNTNGAWGAEFQVEKTKLSTGTITFESKKGITAHTNQPTFVAYQNADEKNGDVYFCALGYSGNFKVEAQRDYRGLTRAMLGVSDFDFSYTLKVGEDISTPKAYLGYCLGFGNMSNTMNEFAIDHILPKNFAKKPLPVLYNSWEATGFDVNTKGQLELAKLAKQIGCELFVIDDGWFGDRHDDHQGLGDWYVNEEKFPNGIDELIDGVNALGMDFGLWFEPEMVQKKSKLFLEHPDWIYHYPNRENTEQRHQLLLNLTKPEVKKFVFDVMDKMLSEHNIKYIKWDMNRPFSEIGAENLDNLQELWLRHTQAVYDIADRLKSKYPYLQLEACSSGGGRADLGALEHFDMIWTSDNTDPLDRMTIQYGFSQFYPIKCMRAWVTDWNSNKRPVSLDYRFASSMQGSLCVGSNLTSYSKEDLEKSKKYIAQYKDFRNTIQFGNLYRLKNNNENEYWANQYVSTDKKKSILFVMTEASSLDNKHFKILRLRGLNPKAIYRFEYDEKEYNLSGNYLMNKGLELNLNKPLDSLIITFTFLD